MRISDKVLTFFWRRIFSPLYSSYLRASGAFIGRGVIFYGKPDVRIERGGRLTIGPGVVLCSRSANTALQLYSPVRISLLSPTANISIGNNCGISGGSLCAVSSVTLGSDCLVGANCVIADTDFHPISPSGRRHAPLSTARNSPIEIGNNVFIGTGAIILKGVRIHDGSVVGAGEVVRSSTSEATLIVGGRASRLRE